MSTFKLFTVPKHILLAGATLLALFGLMFAGATAVSAEQSPDDCSSNSLELILDRNASTVLRGESVDFTVEITNGNGSACDVIDASVWFVTPGPDGLLDGVDDAMTEITDEFPLFGGSLTDFPADGTGNDTVTSVDELTLSFDTDTLNPSASSFKVAALVGGSGDISFDGGKYVNDTPLAVLLDNPASGEGQGSEVQASKTLTQNAVSPSTVVDISSSSAEVQAGGTVDLTVTEENDGNSILNTPSVVVNDGSSDIATLVDPPDSGDTNTNSVLDPGETWSWTISNVVVNANTTFTATGHGIEPINDSDVTWCEDPENPAQGIFCDQDEQDDVSVSVINPSTIVDISSSVAEVQAGGTVDLTVTEENDGDVDLTNVSVDVDNGVGNLSSPPDSGDVADPGVLNVGETWSWTVSGVVVNSNTTFTAVGHGTDTLGNDVTWTSGCEIQEPEEGILCDAEEQDSVEVTTVSPSTITSISSSAAAVDFGGTVDLTITEENDGNVDLLNAYVEVDNGIGPLDETHPNFSSNLDGDSDLEVGETWTWVITTAAIESDTTYTATGHGTDSLGNDVTWCEGDDIPDDGILCDQDEQDDVTVEVRFNPTTDVDASVDLDVVVSGTEVTLTITETNDGDVDLTNPYVGLSPLGLTLDESSSEFTGTDTGGDGILSPLEVWTWQVSDTPGSDTTYVAIGHGDDPQGNDITWCEDTQNPPEGVTCDQDERAEVSVDVTSPSTITTITSSASEVSAGDTVDLTVTEENDGDTDLDNVEVVVNDGSSDIATLIAPPDAGDDGDGILEPGETWSWTVANVVVNEDTTYTATGSGTDTLGNEVTWCSDLENPGEGVLCDQDEQDSVDVTTVSLAWCSPGYWRNHLDEAEAAAAAGGFSLGDTYSSIFGDAPELKKKAQKDGANPDPTLLEVLQSPQYYGGDAFNMVGDLLSEAHPDVEFNGDRIEDSCPLN